MMTRCLLALWLCALPLVSVSGQASGTIDWTVNPGGSVTFYNLEQLFPGIGGRSGPSSGPAALRITVTDCSDTLEDVAYAGCTITADGGTGAGTYTWDESGSALGSGACTGMTFTDSGDNGSLAGTPTTAGTCTFTARVTDTAPTAVTQSISFEVQAAATIPAPWAHTDIGTGQAAGNATETAGTWTVTGAGTHLGTSDQGHYVYQLVSGNYEIFGRVTACTQINGLDLCGIELRSSLAANAARMYCGRQVDGTPLLRYRLTDGAASQSTSGSGVVDYFRIVNLAGQVTCYYGTNGTSWTQHGATHSLTLGTYAIGFVAFSSAAEQANLTTGTFTTITTDSTPDDDTVDSGAYRPHHQGPGTTTRGGAGGTSGWRVYIVNTTADNITAPVLVDTVGGVGIYTSSYRAAVDPTTCTPRYVVFSTSGTIYLSLGVVNIDCPYLTIAGQTAASPGVTIAQREVRINTNDVVNQHVRYRHGDFVSGASGRAIWTHGGDGASGGAATFNVVHDHISTSWGTDETFGFGASGNPGPQDITVLDSLSSEPLDTPDGGTANHARMTSSNPRPNGTMLMSRTVYAHSDTRNPSVRSGWQWAHVNNLLYNYRGSVGGPNHGGIVFQCLLSETNLIEGVVIGNVFLPGPETPSAHIPIKVSDASAGVCPVELFVEDNRCTGAACPSAYATTGAGQCTTPSLGDNQWLGVYKNGLTEAAVREDCRPSWFTGQITGTILELASSTIEAYVSDNAGARPLDRDAHDTRIIAEIAARTGSIKDSLDAPGTVPPSGEVASGNVAALAENSNHSALLTAIQAIDPDDPGTCGTMFDGFVRTEMMCLLESHASYGAQRLEMYQGAP